MQHRLRLLFLPHKKNGYVPHAARHHVLVGYSLALLCAKVLSVALLLFLPASSAYSSAITASNVLELTNVSRNNSGLPELALNATLSAAANAKAKDMLEKQYFAHVSPDGITPWSWIKGAGYTYTVAAENLAVHYTSTEAMQDAWMASPSHRANILDSRFTEIGVGIAQGTFEGADATIVVSMFGKPKVDGPVKNVAIAPTPEPEPVPEAEPVKTDESLVATAFVATPASNPNTYTVKLTNALAESAHVVYNGEVTPLVEGERDGEFVGEITTPTVPQGSEPIIATVVDAEGKAESAPVAVLDASTNTAGFFAFVPAQATKLFRAFNVSVIHDKFAIIYAATAIFIAALFLGTVLVRFERSKHSVAAHLLIVFLLSVGLWML